MAFFRSGRFSVVVAMRSSTSKRTISNSDIGVSFGAFSAPGHACAFG
jgi:hypothetical protein